MAQVFIHRTVKRLTGMGEYLHFLVLSSFKDGTNMSGKLSKG
jgi:hypothetical protein